MGEGGVRQITLEFMSENHDLWAYSGATLRGQT